MEITTGRDFVGEFGSIGIRSFMDHQQVIQWAICTSLMRGSSRSAFPEEGSIYQGWWVEVEGILREIQAALTGQSGQTAHKWTLLAKGCAIPYFRTFVSAIDDKKGHYRANIEVRKFICGGLDLSFCEEWYADEGQSAGGSDSIIDIRGDEEPEFMKWLEAACSSQAYQPTEPQ